MNTEEKIFALNMADYVQESFPLRQKLVTVLNEAKPTGREAVIGLLILAVTGAKGGSMSKEAFLGACEHLYNSVSHTDSESDIITTSKDGVIN